MRKYEIQASRTLVAYSILLASGIKAFDSSLEKRKKCSKNVVALLLFFYFWIYLYLYFISFKDTIFKNFVQVTRLLNCPPKETGIILHFGVTAARDK